MQVLAQFLNQIPNKKLLVIFPHPDDETVMAAGLIQWALANSWQVKIICVTNGTLGRINIHGQGRSMVQIRRDELSRASKILGVTDLEFWKFCDGRLKEEVSWQNQVAGSIMAYKPGLVISYGPSGISGHPDHLALGSYIFDLWQNSKLNFQLLWPAFIGETRNFLKTKVATADRLEQAEFKLELDKQAVNVKIEALRAHESQDLASPMDWINLDPNEYFAEPKPNQEYNFSYVNFDLGD